MAATLYFAAFTAANTPTWARADIANGRHGFSATGYAASNSTTTGVPTSGSGNDASVGITLTGLTAGTSYKVWLVWDDGSATSNSGSPVGSAAFEVPFTSTGALSAQAATVAGTAVHLTLHTSTGALVAQAATVSGAAVHPHIATGALEAGAAEVAGSASRAAGEFTAGGALAAQAAAVAGTAAHYTLHSSTGALEAQSAQVAGTAVHYTLHTAEGALVAGSAGVSGAAVDETTFVPPQPNTGAGKSRKPRKRRIQVEVDGEVFDVESQEEAEAVLEKVAADAQQTAKLAVERAARAKKRPTRKVISDARRALQVPEISAPPDLRDMAQQLIGRIQSEYRSALSAIEIAAHMARREREIEEDDEEILMLL